MKESEPNYGAPNLLDGDVHAAGLCDLQTWMGFSLKIEKDLGEKLVYCIIQALVFCNIQDPRSQAKGSFSMHGTMMYHAIRQGSLWRETRTNGFQESKGQEMPDAPVRKRRRNRFGPPGF
ncbi:hypothetical protein MTO96_035402 [Rhipicephalus appendiculatus]